MKITTDIRLGDCKDELKRLPDDCVDLVVTSPPYADQRRTTYGGIAPHKYVEWFLPISEQLLRALKPTGTFVLSFAHPSAIEISEEYAVTEGRFIKDAIDITVSNLMSSPSCNMRLSIAV